MPKVDLEKLKSKIKKLKKQTNSIKFEVDELTILKDEIPAMIKQEIKSQLSKKIKKLIKKEVEKKMEEARLVLSTKISESYFDFVKEMTKNEVMKSISETAYMKTKSIDMGKATQKSLLEILDKGWRIIFFGDLLPNESSKKPKNIILLGKYVIKNQKSKKKKRNPKKLGK